VVDVVAAEAGAHQLLEQIGLFIAALGRAEAGQRVAAVRIANAGQLPAGQRQGLFPGGGAEIVAPVGAQAIELPALRPPGLAHQRLGQAIGTVHIVEAEPPFDAQAAQVGRAVAAFDALDALVMHVVSDLAADSAERA
jgi:hypothetical protein